MGGPRFGLVPGGRVTLPSALLAACFGCLLRRNDQRLVRSDAVVTGGAVGGGGERDRGGEGGRGGEGAEGLVEDTGDVCSNDFDGVAAPDWGSFF